MHTVRIFKTFLDDCNITYLNTVQSKGSKNILLYSRNEQILYRSLIRFGYKKIGETRTSTSKNEDIGDIRLW